MDDDIEELKELVKKTLAAVEDTNRTVHKMRRSALWGRFFQIVWWVAVIAVSGAAYYYYLQPYVDTLEHLYGQWQVSGQQSPGLNQEIQHFLQNFTTSTNKTAQ